MRHQQRSRADVLRAAEEIFSREGPHGLSVRRIADALGVSRQIVYSRFRGKSELVRALHGEGFEALARRLAAAPGSEGTADHLAALGLAYRESALASPSRFELMFGNPVAEFAPDAEARAVALGAFEPVLRSVRAWHAAHGLAPDEDAARGLARAVWAGTHGVVALEVAGLLPGDVVPTTMRTIVDAVLGAEAVGAAGPADGSATGSRGGSVPDA